MYVLVNTCGLWPRLMLSCQSCLQDSGALSSLSEELRPVLQAGIIFSVQALQFLVEVWLQPDADWHETVLTALSMAADIVPIGMSLVPSSSLECGKLSLGMQVCYR